MYTVHSILIAFQSEINAIFALGDDDPDVATGQVVKHRFHGARRLSMLLLPTTPTTTPPAVHYSSDHPIGIHPSPPADTANMGVDISATEIHAPREEGPSSEGSGSGDVIVTPKSVPSPPNTAANADLGESLSSATDASPFNNQEASDSSTDDTGSVTVEATTGGESDDSTLLQLIIDNLHGLEGLLKHFILIRRNGGTAAAVSGPEE